MSIKIVQSLREVIQDSQVMDKVARKTAAYSITVRDEVVLGSTTADGVAWIATLPSVAEASGKMCLVYMTARNGVKDITVADFKDDAGLDDIVLNAADEYTLLMSNGEKWFELASNHT